MRDLLFSFFIHVSLITGLWSVNWAGSSATHQEKRAGRLTTAPRETVKETIKPRELRKPTQKELAEIAAIFEALQKQSSESPANQPSAPAAPKSADAASTPAEPAPLAGDHKAPAQSDASPSSPPKSADVPSNPAGAAGQAIDYAGEARSKSAALETSGVGVAVVPQSTSPRAERNAPGVRAPEYEFADTTGKIHHLLLEDRKAFVLILPPEGKETFVFDGAICWKDDGSVLSQVAARSPTMPPEMVRAALAALAQSEYGSSRAAAEVRFVTTNLIDNAILAAQKDAAKRIGKPMEQIALTRITAIVKSAHMQFIVTQATLQDRQVVSIH